MFLGARFGMFTRGEKILSSACRLAQVDVDGEELGKLRKVDIPVNADCLQTLHALNASAGAYAWPDWSTWSAQVHTASRWHVDAYRDAGSSGATVHPYRALSEVMAALDEDTIVCADGGETSQWAELLARSKRAGQYTGHGYLGCLGIGMPFAIGSQVAHPDRRVVCIVGDGAAGINVQEFDTMVRHSLPVVTVVLNNKAWGMCLHGQQSMYGNNRLVVTTLGDGRYDKVAEAFGCFGAYVEDVADVQDAVRAALQSKRPACINIITDIDAVFGSQQAPKKEEIEMPYYENLKQDQS
jgi:acetolactate synthase-1/2/3 large subunit